MPNRTRDNNIYNRDFQNIHPLNKLSPLSRGRHLRLVVCENVHIFLVYAPSCESLDFYNLNLII